LGFDPDTTFLFPIILFIAVIILIIVLLSFFNVNIPKNNFILTFFLSIILFFLMMTHIYLISNWINRVLSFPIDAREVTNIYLGYGIWVCTISAVIMIIFALLAAYGNEQFINFKHWKIQKKIFVFLLLISFFTFQLHGRLHNIILFFTVIITVFTISEIKSYDIVIKIIWILVLMMFGLIIIQNIIYHTFYDLLFTSSCNTDNTLIILILCFVLILILIWSKISNVNMLELKKISVLEPKLAPTPEPEHIEMVILDKEKPILDEETLKVVKSQPKIAQQSIDVLPKYINKEKTIEHYQELFKISNERASSLFNAGYTSLKEFKDAIPEDLILVQGINPTLARNIISKTKIINKQFKF